MPDCVKVARQTLTLFVWVRILVRQPEFAVDIETFYVDRFFMQFLSIIENLGLKKPTIDKPTVLTSLERETKEK